MKMNKNKIFVIVSLVFVLSNFMMAKYVGTCTNYYDAHAVYVVNKVLQEAIDEHFERKQNIFNVFTPLKNMSNARKAVETIRDIQNFDAKIAKTAEVIKPEDFSAWECKIRNNINYLARKNIV